jgi:uncharacterized protein (DUF433 family)
MNIPAELKDILVADPETLSGAVRFRGTRVPVQALIDTLDVGQGIEEFLDGWPNVPREHAEAVIHWQQNLVRQVLGLDLVA